LRLPDDAVWISALTSTCLSLCGSRPALRRRGLGPPHGRTTRAGIDTPLTAPEKIRSAGIHEPQNKRACPLSSQRETEKRCVPSPRCSVCHRTSIQAGLAIVGPPRTPRACFDCHPKADTLATHAHLLKPLDRCQSCHSLHDSIYKDLLKAPPK
jgi:hypothetical protein